MLALQSEKKRLEKESKTLSERVIEAQRASAPVPRCVTTSNLMQDRDIQLQEFLYIWCKYCQIPQSLTGAAFAPRPSV